MVAVPILEEYRNSIEDFGKVLIEHCIREYYVVAHLLTQGRADPLALWKDSPHGFIMNSLADNEVLFKLLMLARRPSCKKQCILQNFVKEYNAFYK